MNSLMDRFGREQIHGRTFNFSAFRREILDYAVLIIDS
jgi:hypothetical protein